MPRHICPHCGTLADPVSATRGSFAIELFLWLMLLLPGIIYSLWRLTSKRKVCPSCRQEGMVPINTPRGRALRDAYHPPEPKPSHKADRSKMTLSELIAKDMD